MCSVFTHPAIPLALSIWLPHGADSTALLLTGVACSVLPDLDVVSFPLGIPYGALLGHRGVSHSLTLLANSFQASLSVMHIEEPRSENTELVLEQVQRTSR